MHSNQSHVVAFPYACYMQNCIIFNRVILRVGCIVLGFYSIIPSNGIMLFYFLPISHGQIEELGKNLWACYLERELIRDRFGQCWNNRTCNPGYRYINTINHSTFIHVRRHGIILIYVYICRGRE